MTWIHSHGFERGARILWPVVCGGLVKFVERERCLVLQDLSNISHEHCHSN